MIHVIEQYTQAKSTTTPSEDAVVVTASYAAVIDGATPKTDFRYPGGERPGLLAARLTSEAIRQLPAEATAAEAVSLITARLHQEGVRACDRPIASCIIYSAHRREVWMLGDCHFATIDADGTMLHYTNEKRIDRLLADWRRAIISSYLSRELMTTEELLTDDPGRRIIQPFITRQVQYQNLDSPHRLAYCMLDGEPVPERFIRIHSIEPSVQQLVLATDGYPELFPTLAETEQVLQQLLHDDPLCIGPLLGTKGILPGSLSFDDRTYLRIQTSQAHRQ